MPTTMKQRSARAKDPFTEAGALSHRRTALPADPELLCNVLGALSQGIAVFDRDGKLLLHNARYLELLDFPEGFIELGTSHEAIQSHYAERGILQTAIPQASNDSDRETPAGPPASPSRIDRIELTLPSGRIVARRRTSLPDGGFVCTYTNITVRKEAEKRATADRTLLQAIIDNMADGIRVFDGNLRLIAFNKRAFDFLDLPPHLCRLGVSYEDIARYIADRGDYGNDSSSFADRVARARKATGRSTQQTLPDGRIVQKRRNAMPGGGFVSTYSDITRLKRAEAALAEKAEALETALAELRRSNSELEQFAYVASHDLQEPLRMVASYCQLLGRRYRDRLDDDAREFIDYAVDGAARMQQLINDLLTYSRVGSRAKEPVAVDLGTVLDAALLNLKVAVEDSGGRITRDPLPTVMGDDVQLTQLFQNLIGNALKFRREVPPEIHVGAAEEPERWLISVADNGIGMESAYFDRIFVIFQRLHERGKYPGTGIGLAICKKIVERHGGRIEVASEPGRGTTFTIALPKRGVAP